MIGVEAHSLLPNNQNNGGNLSGQSQPRHLRSHALGQQCRVKLLERAGFGGSDDRRSLEQILQIVIAILVQSAHLDRFFLALKLAFDYLVIGAAVHFDTQTTVGPQLPVGAEPVRRLQDPQQHRRPDRTDRGNLAEPFPDLVLLALHKQISSYFSA